MQAVHSKIPGCHSHRLQHAWNTLGCSKQGSKFMTIFCVNMFTFYDPDHLVAVHIIYTVVM